MLNIFSAKRSPIAGLSTPMFVTFGSTIMAPSVELSHTKVMLPYTWSGAVTKKCAKLVLSDAFIME